MQIKNVARSGFRPATMLPQHPFWGNNAKGSRMTNEQTPNARTHSADTPRSQGRAGDFARGEPEATDRLNGRSGGGDSGGGAYPNPHSGKEGKGGKDGFMGSGGQTEMAYHGTGQLGRQKVGGNANAPARKTGSEAEKDKS